MLEATRDQFVRHLMPDNPSRVIPADVPIALASYPPLDQVTVVRDEDVRISVLLDVSAAHSTDAWQVAVWHSFGGEWEQLDLSPSTEESSVIFTLKSALPTAANLAVFQGRVSVSEKCLFTIKFKHGDDEDWQWTKEHWGTGDGTIIFNSGTSPEDVPDSLPRLIKDLNPAWHWNPVNSQSPKTSVWTLTAPVEGTTGKDPVYKDIALGVPFGGFLRWFAIVRVRRPWMVPRQGRDKFELDRPAIITSFVGVDGRHMVLLAVSGTNDVMTLLGHGPSGIVSAKARNDGTSTESATVIAATAHDHDSAVAAAMYEARSMVMSSKAMKNELAQELSTLGSVSTDDVGNQWYENWYDGLGYCTWNAFGRDITDEKIFNALDTLAKSDVQVTNLIIDDNWQSVEHNKDGVYHEGWQDFEAGRESFPLGLKKTVERIRREHPDIRYIAVWHALLGYWGGVSPRSKLAEKYKTTRIVREPEEQDDIPIGGPIDVIARESITSLYEDFYRFLASCDIDSVKTDVQFMLDTVIEAAPRREMMREYLDAWAIASLRHLGNRAISCMSHTPQILFYGLLPNNRPPVLFRNSGDFYPAIEASHAAHVWTNAHNSVFSSHLNVLPDWDMFQSVHGWSKFHAAARCVSGGPIYITDIPGKHDIDLIRQVSGTSIRGKTVIFRPSVPAKTTDPYVGYHDKKLLKVGSYHGRVGTGSSFLGLFNVSTESVTELISFSSFPGLTRGSRYIVRSHNGRITKPILSVAANADLFHERLDVRGWNILTATPVLSFDAATLAHRPLSVSTLGLLDKMTGAAAIISNEANIDARRSRLSLEVRLKALGTLGVYISTLDELDIDDDFMITILDEPIPVHTVAKGSDNVLKIDLDAAWKEMGLHSRWANELIVKLYFSISLSCSTACLDR